MELTIVNIVQAVANLYLPPGNTKMNYLRYSIIVVTSSAYELELVTLLHISPDPTLTREYLTMTSSKFDLTVDQPYISVMIQWAVGTGNISAGRYRFKVTNFIASGNSLSVRMDLDDLHFLVSTRLNALFVGKRVQSYNIAWFENSYLLGEAYPSAVVDFNLGIN